MPPRHTPSVPLDKNSFAAAAWTLGPVFLTAAAIAIYSKHHLSIGSAGWLILLLAAANLAIYWCSRMYFGQRAAAGITLTLVALLMPIGFYMAFASNSPSIDDPFSFYMDGGSIVDRGSMMAAFGLSGLFSLALMTVSRSERWALPGFLYIGLAAPLMFTDFFTDPQSHKHALLVLIVALIALGAGRVLATVYHRGDRSAGAAGALLLIYAYSLTKPPSSPAGHIAFACILLLATSLVLYLSPSVGASLAVLISVVVFSSVVIDAGSSGFALLLLLITIAVILISGYLLLQSPPDDGPDYTVDDHQQGGPGNPPPDPALHSPGTYADAPPPMPQTYQPYNP